MLSTSCLALSPRIAVVGGGASGVFSAIAAAENSPAEVVVLEAGRETLTKVAISGGGRCNVLHDTSKPVSEILNGYPRGKKELTGLLQKRFPPSSAREWFERRGVVLKTESDGRMFPNTDSSQTIINVLLKAAEEAGVTIEKQCKTTAIVRQDNGFQVSTHGKKKDSPIVDSMYDAVILATGSAPGGYKLASSLGLKLVKPVPSLFTLSAKQQVKEGGLFYGLSGLSVPEARITFKVAVPGRKKKKALQQQGPLLITHHGISGPATLRLSAFGARDFYDINYKGDVSIHWAPELGTTDEIFEKLWTIPSLSPKRFVATSCPLMRDNDTAAIPKRLWQSFCTECGIDKETTWGGASKKTVRALARIMSECTVHVTGKGVFKEEFVTAGGVSLKEIDMRTMQAKSCPGLFLCGEVIDVDGITGGYNFMNCWSTGYVAGTSAAKFVAEQRVSAEQSVK